MPPWWGVRGQRPLTSPSGLVSQGGPGRANFEMQAWKWGQGDPMPWGIMPPLPSLTHLDSAPGPPSQTAHLLLLPRRHLAAKPQCEHLGRKPMLGGVHTHLPSSKRPHMGGVVAPCCLHSEKNGQKCHWTMAHVWVGMGFWGPQSTPITFPCHVGGLMWGAGWGAGWGLPRPPCSPACRVTGWHEPPWLMYVNCIAIVQAIHGRTWAVHDGCQVCATHQPSLAPTHRGSGGGGRLPLCKWHLPLAPHPLWGKPCCLDAETLNPPTS